MIYAGRIDSIGEYTLDLRDFFVLNKNKWESFAWKSDEDTKELYYDNDTFIYIFDGTDPEKGRKIDSQELLNGEYHVDEDKAQDDHHKKLRDYYAYIYTDGDRIAGIYLRKSIDSVLRQKIVTATLDKNQVKAKGALVMKNGVRIKTSELKKGDKIYMVMDETVSNVDKTLMDRRARVIVVK